MKKTGIILILILSTNLLRADYSPLKLYELVIKADKILYGTIVELDSGKYKLHIEGSLTGETGTITILRFTDWPCAYRWTEYEIGQRLFVFLFQKNGNYITMSAGNEGELPIQNDTVYINGFSLRPPPPLLAFDEIKDSTYLQKLNELEYFEYGDHNVFGTVYSGEPIHLKDFIKSITDIRKCFEFEYGKYNSIINGKLLCPDIMVTRKLKEDKLFRWTYQDLIKITGGNNSYRQ